MNSSLRHPHRFSLLLAALTAAVAMTWHVPGRAQATTVTTSETVPFTSSILNPCNGDTVAFSGDVHLVNHVTTDASGGTHVETQSNFSNVSGTGQPSNATYRVTTTRQTSVNDSSTPQSELTVVQVINVVGQGSTPKFRLFVTYHITVNANGQTTSEVSNVESVCPGGRA